MKVLVLGDGLLGGEVVHQTGWDYISRKKDGFNINDVNSLPTDYEVILNCIANTNTYSDDSKAHWDTNYAFVNNLIDFCNTNNIKLVHISTDYVYAGSETNASEETVPVHCGNWYTYTKLLSDGLVQLRSNNYLLCRCTQIPKPFPYDKAWVDRFGNLDYVDVIADFIISMIKHSLSGLYNVGTEVKSTYDLAKQTRPDVGKSYKPEHAPKDLTMDVSKLKKEMGKPFFSIAIPTYGYNGKGLEFLEFSLDIINKQTFKNFEIVLSDHSIDDTIFNVYNNWKDKLNIKYIRNEKGRGIISPNINNAIKHCNGKWIKVLFQDDFLYNNNSLQIQHDFITRNPEAKWFMTKFYHSNTGTDFYKLYTPRWVDHQWTGHNLMGCPSGLTLKNESLLFFDEELNWYMDIDYYQKLYIKYGKPYILDEITTVNRTWGARLTDTISKDIIDKEHRIINERYA
jgi:dTDP-4-dehydrorhamnose reductase